MFSSRMRQAVAALGLTCCLALPSCLAGPHQMSRTVDDWEQELYVKSPWMGALSYPVVALVKGVARVGDIFIGDAIAFWLDDAWDSEGTGFMHYQPEFKNGYVKSMLFEDDGFGKVFK